MDPTIPTPTVSSTVTTSSISMQAPPSTPMQLLEISLISAQDLTPVSKSMRTYAVAWVNPSRKLTTRTDQHGLTHPTWNEKLTFRVDNRFLLSDDAAITIEIYTVSWFREVLVGTVRALISDLLAPPSGTPLQNHPKSIRFVALQVRRPSGTPQGILNMGVALLDSSMRSMPLSNNPFKSPARGDDFLHAVEKKVNMLNIEQNKNEDKRYKVHLWRSLSLGSEVNDKFPAKNGSIYNPGSTINGSTCNGSSIVNGSELCSDIGPSASIVAAELAKKCQPSPQPLAKRPIRYDETGSSIPEELTFEEAMAKGYRIRTNRERWRKQASGGKHDYDIDDHSDISSNCNRHSRRNSDGGLFSCFGNAYGIEFKIVCGASNHPSSSKRHSNSSSRKNIKPSEVNSA
ncbi:hypothetical protein OROGR_002277 [Orobanche gracilis]